MPKVFPTFDSLAGDQLSPIGSNPRRPRAKNFRSSITCGVFSIASHYGFSLISSTSPLFLSFFLSLGILTWPTNPIHHHVSRQKRLDRRPFVPTSTIRLATGRDRYQQQQRIALPIIIFRRSACKVRRGNITFMGRIRRATAGGKPSTGIRIARR